ncbi:hypothetical protein DLM45_01365 [Hyphomicrobium methylovorum]|uniref:DUF4384 domain-containing protein n=1 Tax=Hyphomicrobium methylovorum TaxID=84 RepID=UPI0015E766E9|nr:DUF4384 domain-containing protein [Hyphomicrobium methylovorum]MBA2124873.1 hypothetical protein [Hyphomicrobium methylovorum]
MNVISVTALTLGLLVVLCVGAKGALAQNSAPVNASSVGVPPRPEEARAAKAYTVIETYCSRCHQAGRLERPLASGGLADILSLDVLARDPVVVKPGLPDASRLYEVFEARHAPLDLYSTGTAEPQPEEIQAVREWIKDLAPDVATCPLRHPVKSADVARMLRDAQRLERDQGGDVRFISLVHLYNACTSDADMAAYGQALNKLINGVSHASRPVKLTSLDAAGTVYSFRLADIGWTPERWERIARSYPPTLVRPFDDAITKTAGTNVAIVNGDWLAATIEAPLYYELLDTPAKLSDLAEANGVDIAADIKSGAARRIARRTSAVTRANRLIERHPGARGGLWLVYDFATATGDQDIFEHPHGPKSASDNPEPFRHDEVRVIYTLPNGFYAYALFDAQGHRVDRVLPGIEKLYAGAEADAIEPTTRAGGKCQACHTQGLVAAIDEFKSAGPTDASAPRSPIRATALPLYATDSENALLMLGGTENFQAAAKTVGIDLNLRIRGEELIQGLARRYREDADFESALSETGQERDAFMRELAAAKGQAAPLARRLLHGVLSRPELDRLFALLQGIDEPRQSSFGGFLRDEKTEIGLSLWFDKPRPVPGDLITVKAEADNDCYLTVISVDAAGIATILFPNDFERDNRLTAAKPISIPGKAAPFQLRFKSEGSETLLGRCSTSATPPIGIEHDFERQRFTALGNWENFIQDTLVTEAEMRLSPEKAERARIARSGALRRRVDSGERIEPRRPDIDTGGVALRDGRAVLILGQK